MNKIKTDPFSTHDDAGYKDSLKGIRQKTLVHGRKTLMVEFRLQKGAVLPLHKHLMSRPGTWFPDDLT